MDNTSDCKHYIRRCKLVTPCCDKIYTCRLCHDEEQNSDAVPITNHHNLDRTVVTLIICINCNKEQPVSNQCISCDTQFGNYFCSICRLFDDTDKGQFHCAKCNICRIGGAENYTHCDSCNMCMSNSFDSHKCISTSEYTCPICDQAVFDSTTPITSPKCGHWIHHLCMTEYLKTNYKCPVCSVSLFDITELNSMIDAQIEQMPMPPEYSDTICNILCNDCHVTNETKLHFYAVKCPACGSYNTKQI
jgi:RING finger/CHY zinc finger protein 1